MFLKIGHRWAAGYEPENTLASFQKAIDLNVDMIELDVYLCKTGELVVLHDPKVDRTTNGIGYIEDKTFEELRKLDAGKGEKIPTLQEVLDLVDKRVQVNIELKWADTATAVGDLIQEYINTKERKTEHFVVSSFNHYELQTFKKQHPQIRIGALLWEIPLGLAKFWVELDAWSVNLCNEFINQEFVDDGHQRWLKVLVWTTNDLDDIEKMKNLWIDWAFSNFPDRL